MLPTINSISEALTHGGRFRSLENVRLIAPQPTMRDPRTVDFDVSVGGVDCVMRCRLDGRQAPRQGWRLLERELMLFSGGGEAVEMDVMIRPLPFLPEPETKAGNDYEEYVRDPVWGVTVAMRDGEWVLLDGDDRPLTDRPYDWMGECSEGMVVVLRDGKYGYVDVSGREVIAPQYDDADSFCSGRALVRRGDESFYISAG